MKPLFLCLAMLCALTSKAQLLQAHLAYDQSALQNAQPGLVEVQGTPNRNYAVTSTNARASYGAGIGVRAGYADLKPAFLQVELSAMYQKNTFSVRDSTAHTFLYNYTQERVRFDLPVMLGVKVGWVHAVGGIFASLALPEKGIAKDFTTGWTEAFNTTNLGYCYGLGLDISHYASIDLRVQNDFGSRVESTYVPDLSQKARHYFGNNAYVLKVACRISRDKE